MGKLFNKRVLLFIPVMFLIIIILRVTFAYNDVKQREHNFAKKESEVLSSYAMTHRNFYQKFFVNNDIELNARTLPALPAHSSYPISKIFSQNNSLNTLIKTVSDVPRNSNNVADSDEMKAINFFKKNTKEEYFFDDENPQFYQFAYALRIDKTCLKCHGNKENAPIFIQERYAEAYDYKLGDLRGILSIKLPTENLHQYFYRDFFYSILYDISLFIALFIAIFYLIKKSKNINEFLEDEIEIKAQELKNNLVLDALTGLPNRLKLLEDIKNNTNAEYKHLALINVDSFKDINEFYGYDIGDAIIKELSFKIKSLSPETNIYKLPSDEYAIFTTLSLSQNDFFKIVKNIIKTIHNTPLEIEENSIFITLSCGLVSNESSLLTKADMALQIAKTEKKDIVLYDNTLDKRERITKNIEGISLLKDAIKQNQITPYYQPIYNVHTKKIEKYESLARIVLEDGKVILPSKFLDIAIKSKLYPEITKAVISKSFEFFKESPCEFSINLSINDIIDSKTRKFIVDSLTDFKEPQRVVFEILESEKIGNYEELKEFIDDIKKFGCKFAIDDFGSGYSNFAHILELNIDYLKIDASLVKYIATDENSRIITKTIINFASNLGLKTIAEFVEDKDSLEILEKMGIDYIQGYYIGKPDVGLNRDRD